MKAKCVLPRLHAHKHTQTQTPALLPAVLKLGISTHSDCRLFYAVHLWLSSSVCVCLGVQLSQILIFKCLWLSHWAPSLPEQLASTQLSDSDPGQSPVSHVRKAQKTNDLRPLDYKGQFSANCEAGHKIISVSEMILTLWRLLTWPHGLVILSAREVSWTGSIPVSTVGVPQRNHYGEADCVRACVCAHAPGVGGLWWQRTLCSCDAALLRLSLAVSTFTGLLHACTHARCSFGPTCFVSVQRPSAAGSFCFHQNGAALSVGVSS